MAVDYGEPLLYTPTNSGLLQNDINAMVVDADLRLWIGSRENDLATRSRDRVRLVLCDTRGNEVRRLLDDDPVDGSRSILLDASGLPSGAYSLRLRTGGHLRVEPVVIE